ncbi:MAG TPA: CRTAC1 family protein, partial [Opitutaceae bacterium]
MAHALPRRLRLVAFLALAASRVAGSADTGGNITQKPLSAHPFPPGKTMFAHLSPEETGIRTENAYDDPRMWGDLYQEFEVGSIGTGVAIGDFDGDGRPDIFVVSKTGRCWLFRNLGGYRFEDVTEKAGVGGASGVWTQGATFVDINNSGRLDIYVCRFNAPNLLYINQGNGTFKEMAHAYGLDVVDASVQASFCDYDRDGWLDLYLVTNLLDIARHPHGEADYLFHNNRNGTFTNVTDRAGISGPGQGHSATWWDYDNDGWPDLYVANDFGTPDKLYRNNGDGTFTDILDGALPHTSFSSMGADVGDVRNDGFVDLLVADMARTTHQGDQRTEAASRSKAMDPPDNSSAAMKYERNALLVNTGTGRALEAAHLAGIAATDWTWSVRLEDFDNDGHLDLFVTNGMNREQNNVDILSRTMSAETPADRIRIMHDSPVLAQAHRAYRAVGDLQFEDVSKQWGLDQKGVAFGAATGDLSGDGNLDLVYSNYGEGVTVLRNDLAQGHVVNVDLRGTLSNRYGVGATVTVESALGSQVRPLWLARGYMSSSEPMVHFG